MAEIDLERLAEDVDGRSVLIVGERHFEDRVDEMLDIIQAYRPDAISIELLPFEAHEFYAGPLREAECTDPLKRTWEIAGEYPSSSSMDVASVYALLSGTPLYCTEMSEEDPTLLASLQWSEKTGLTSYEGAYGHRLGFVLDGFGAVEVGKIFQEERAWVRKGMDLDYSQRFVLMSSQPLMICERDRWTAEALNHLPGERVLHVAGADHIYMDDRPDGLTGLQDLIDADLTMVVDIRSGDHSQEILSYYDVDAFPIDIPHFERGKTDD